VVGTAPLYLRDGPVLINEVDASQPLNPFLEIFMIFETTAHRLIRRQVDFLQGMLSDSDKIAFDAWLGDQSWDLELEDKEVAQDLEKWALALSEIKGLEEDCAKLEKLQKGLKTFKEVLDESYE
jgi:hypothetical protein